MKAMVLGLGGVGTVIARELARAPQFGELLLADVDGERARRVAEEIGLAHVRACRVDAGNRQELRAALDGVGILVNAVIPRYNLTVMEACLEAGCNYLDMASDGPVELPGRVTIWQQLEYDARFREAGLTAILCLGVDPGATGLFARWAADRMDTVEAIMIRDGDNSTVEGYELAVYFSPDTSIEECLQPSYIYKDGEYVLGEPLETGVETFNFPEPVGPMVVRSVPHEDVGTLPLHIGKGLRYVDFKYALDPKYVQVLKVLRMLGLASPEPIRVGDVMVAPRDVVTALLPRPADLGGRIKGHLCVGTLVRGTEDGHPVEYFLYNLLDHEEVYRRYGVNATVWQTAIPAVVGVELLAEGHITRKGVLVPEQLEPEPFFRRLQERGWYIWVEKKTRTRM
ncbi:MAG: saccharopine dehydrogenase C-terminal domain-containing protein [Bacillota bacterium]